MLMFSASRSPRPVLSDGVAFAGVRNDSEKTNITVRAHAVSKDMIILEVFNVCVDVKLTTVISPCSNGQII